jgi:hypothetical protein
VSKSENYGLVLVCYARAHSRRKVKSVVDLLISYSLVQSRAYPAFGDLDADLRSLTADPKAYLSGLAGVDEEAAGLLQFYFSGYATLRRFYEIRDEAVALKDGQRPHFKPLARRRAAAQALVAVIGSAADSIYGGLYDPERDSAVQVDGLLALLAEALAFVDRKLLTCLDFSANDSRTNAHLVCVSTVYDPFGDRGSGNSDTPRLFAVRGVFPLNAPRVPFSRAWGTIDVRIVCSSAVSARNVEEVSFLAYGVK